MSEPARPSPLVFAAMAAAAVGALVALALFVKPGPYTLVAFMFVAQPLLAVAALFLGVQALKDVRRSRVL